MKTPKPLPSRRCRTCAGTGREPRVTGPQLRKLRLEAKIGLRELSRRTGLDDSLISRAENEKGPALKPDQLRLYLREIGHPGWKAAAGKLRSPRTLEIVNTMDEDVYYRIGRVAEPADSEPEN